MTIRYPDILKQQTAPQTWLWEDRDAILYALCLGLGSDPLNQRALAYLYENPLRVVPTLPTVLAWVARPTFTELGIDPITALHGEQKIVLHRPLSMPLKASVLGRVLAVYDKGPGRGAIVVTQHDISDSSDGSPVATLTTTCFGRTEGGCGGSAEPPPKPPAIPLRAPDLSADYPTRPDLALLYRLTGDRNPIHADPAVARNGGFDRPLLHGLCSFGIGCRAVLEHHAGYDPSRILSQQARFSSPVYPGETLTVDLWRDGDEVSFRIRVKARNAVVLDHGRCVLRPE